MANMGLVQAARQIESYGRGPDTELAHISPDEAQFVDYLQGGRRTNPHTGLAEYSMFGKILKSVARVAGAVGGFMIGGPAGAALGAGAATKLTGGSWKDALKGAALSGIGGELGQGLTGGGWNVLGAAPGAAAGAAAPATMSVGSGAGLGGIPVSEGLASVAVPAASAAAPATGLAALGQLAAPIGGYGSAAAGLGALSVPMPMQGDSGPSGPPPGYGGNINLNVAPQTRAYRPYTGDYSKYGQAAGQGGAGGWQFFDQVNPKPIFLAEGGGVMAPHQPGNGIMGLGALHQLGIPSQIQSPGITDPMQARAMGSNLSPGAQRDEIRRAAIMGYVNAKEGGSIHGPGGPEDDSVPALLSNNENVWDAKTVKLAGNGSYERGHRKMQTMKEAIRRKAGVKNPKKPPAFQGAH